MKMKVPGKQDMVLQPINNEVCSRFQNITHLFIGTRTVICFPNKVYSITSDLPAFGKTLKPKDGPRYLFCLMINKTFHDHDCTETSHAENRVQSAGLGKHSKHDESN